MSRVQNLLIHLGHVEGSKEEPFLTFTATKGFLVNRMNTMPSREAFRFRFIMVLSEDHAVFANTTMLYQTRRPAFFGGGGGEGGQSQTSKS